VINPSSATAAINTWTHLTGVYDSSAATITFYINGSSVASTTKPSSWTATGTLQAGRQLSSGAWSNPFQGLIDDVHVYKRALSATEVASLYNPPAAAATAAMTAGVTGALQGSQQGLQSTTAVAFAGSTNAYMNAVTATAPTAFTLECWFRAGGTASGLLMGLFATQTGSSGSRDRLVYLDSGGKLTFGVSPSGTPITIRSSATYTDGAWHHVAATGGPAGLHLYVDGSEVAADTATTTAASGSGYWRWGGGDPGATWPNRPSNLYFTGTLDEVAFYSAQLAAQNVAFHYHANH
jgi:hypothetical protein